MKEYLKLILIIVFFIVQGMVVGYIVNHHNDDINGIIYFLPTILTVMFIVVADKYFKN